MEKYRTFEGWRRDLDECTKPTAEWATMVRKETADDPNEDPVLHNIRKVHGVLAWEMHQCIRAMDPPALKIMRTIGQTPHAFAQKITDWARQYFSVLYPDDAFSFAEMYEEHLSQLDTIDCRDVHSVKEKVSDCIYAMNEWHKACGRDMQTDEGRILMERFHIFEAFRAQKSLLFWKSIVGNPHLATFKSVEELCTKRIPIELRHSLLHCGRHDVLQPEELQ